MQNQFTKNFPITSFQSQNIYFPNIYKNFPITKYLFLQYFNFGFKILKKHFEIAITEKFRRGLKINDRDIGNSMLDYFLSYHCVFSLVLKFMNQAQNTVVSMCPNQSPAVKWSHFIPFTKNSTKIASICLLQPSIFNHFNSQRLCNHTAADVGLRLVSSNFIEYSFTDLREDGLIRLPEKSPAKLALRESLRPIRRPRGKPKTTWIAMINNDLKYVNLKLGTAEIEEAARDRESWRAITRKIEGAMSTNDE